jgi:type I restriction enzyme S subunit
MKIGEAFMTGSAGQKRVPTSFIENFLVALPPLSEQRQIAHFLDHKTAQIDAAIEKGRRLIELLREERAALINQAVTAGIDEHGYLRTKPTRLPAEGWKDSGVEWLGAVPEEWEVVKLKYLGQIKYGLGQPPKQQKNGIPLIRATNINRGKLTEKNMIFVDPDDVPYERDPVLQENDILVVRSGAYTADSARVPKNYEGAIAGYDMVFTPERIHPFFIAYGLLSNYILFNQLYLLRLRAAQPHLNAEELGDTLVLCPPIDEQKNIVKYIETETSRIDQEISILEREIELLAEYRQALISEAVTGKIDVREVEVDG